MEVLEILNYFQFIFAWTLYFNYTSAGMCEKAYWTPVKSSCFCLLVRLGLMTKSQPLKDQEREKDDQKGKKQILRYDCWRNKQLSPSRGLFRKSRYLAPS